MKRIRLFSEFQSVSRGQRTWLHAAGYIEKDDSPVGWVKLSRKMRKMQVATAKMLILLEIERGSTNARLDIIHRLVTLVTKNERRELEARINKHLK